MFKTYLKRNYEKLISTFIAIIATLLTKELVNSSEILKNIVNSELTVWKVFVWILQVVIIMLFTMFIEFLIKRAKPNALRNNVRFKKENPLKNCTKQEKQKEIAETINALDHYTTKIECINTLETDKKLFFCKRYLFYLYALMSTITSIIYYKQQCLTDKNQKPVVSKFSFTEMKIYYNEIEQKIVFIDKIIASLCEEKSKQQYQNNELEYIHMIKKLINNMNNDIKGFIFGNDSN